jgi:hypothetical protein
LAFTNVQFAHAGGYRLVVSNAYGMVASVNAKLAVTLPLGQVLNATNLAWISTGSAPWFGQTAVSYDGIDAARSGAINNGQESILQTTVIGPGRLTWWWKVSSELSFDTLEFRLGGVTQAVISGEVNWEQRSVVIPAGTQTLQWRYSKDLTYSGGQDAGWVDQVVFIPDPPVVTCQPVGSMVNVGASVLLSVAATGSPPLAYQWLKDGTNIADANNSILSLPSATRRNTGTYSVRVSNPGGATLSSNAFVKVLVPQRFGPPALQPDGSVLLTSTDADGGLLLSDDFLGMTAQASTNLVDWAPLPGPLSLTNGVLLIRDPDARNYSRRFYRVSETTAQSP